MIMLTDKAVKEIKRLQEGDDASLGKPLRVQVIGGGCSGMSYKLGFDNEPASELDKIFEKDGVSLIVDNKSFLFLTGTELDFSDGLNGKGFIFANPNAKRTCGCGSSFST
jgi:iron-sulfur cluster assembly protein